MAALVRKLSLLPVSVRNYSSPAAAIKSVGKKVVRKKEEVKTEDIPVETDAYKLVNYVCGTNLFAENGENVKIKPDSEYPDWLWTLHTGPPLKLSEMDPNTLQYWRKVRRLGRRQESYIRSLQPHLRDHK